jgi:hypothetical protein
VDEQRYPSLAPGMKFNQSLLKNKNKINYLFISRTTTSPPKFHRAKKTPDLHISQILGFWGEKNKGFKTSLGVCVSL